MLSLTQESRPSSHRVARFMLSLSLLASLNLTPRPAHAADFIKPTQEELSMTSLPGYPGAPAVLLYREQVTKDDLHVVYHYERLKVLTEAGKKYANVQLGYVSSTGDGWSMGDDKTLEAISGRTIHPDGKIIPFTGKPYLKVLEKANGYKVQQKIFTLPDVEVGSIIEYRYSTYINDHIYEAPVWMLQDDLFVREAHFVWWPTAHTLIDEDEKPITAITWFPVLPPGAKIETQTTPGAGMNGATRTTYELRVKDIPPWVKEDFMPPIRSFSYRVNFSFSPYNTPDEYWRNVGKQWSKRVNTFIGPSSALRDLTQHTVEGANTPDEKLRKIYESVMSLENTSFTRQRDQREDKATGGQITAAVDVLKHERGSPAQLTELFIGMARAAGLNAYAMWIPDRTEDMFTSAWLSTRQLDDYIAVVNLNGQDMFFDPGSRYVPYGQLAWEHTMVSGLRQTADGTAISKTPFQPYKVNHTTRVANLTLDAQGQITGKLDLTFSGAPAVYWRQQALRGDEESLRKNLLEKAESMVPRSLELEVADIKELKSYDKPLAVSYKVKGTLGTAIGKRASLPSDVFLADSTATFPHEKRELAVYFHYPQYVQDAVRINLPHEWSVEAVPTSAHYDMPHLGSYNLQVQQAASNFTTRRDFAFGDVIVLPKEYSGLRTFYSQLESKDQEQVILKPAPAASASNSGPSGSM